MLTYKCTHRYEEMSVYTHTCARVYTSVYMCVHMSIRMHVYKCTHTSSGSVCWRSDTWVAMSTSSIRTLDSKDHSPQKWKSSLQKWLIPGLGLKKYKMSLENIWFLVQQGESLETIIPILTMRKKLNELKINNSSEIHQTWSHRANPCSKIGGGENRKSQFTGS